MTGKSPNTKGTKYTKGEKGTVNPVLVQLPALSVTYRSGNDTGIVTGLANPRPFTLSMGHMMSWTINGRVFEMEAIAEDEKVNINEPITWEWINNSPIPHPMHIYNVQFQVVQHAAPASSSYSTVNQGFVDSGWKDTVPKRVIQTENPAFSEARIFPTI